MLADTASTWPFWAPEPGRRGRGRARSRRRRRRRPGHRPRLRRRSGAAGRGPPGRDRRRHRGRRRPGRRGPGQPAPRPGVDADIRVGDLFDPDLDARRRRVLHLPRAGHAAAAAPTPRHRIAERALVTVDFDGARARADPARRPGPPLPAPRPATARRTGRLGERRHARGHRARLPVAQLPRRSCHPGGAVRRSTPCVRWPTSPPSFAGATDLDGPAHLAVDLRWEPMAAGHGRPMARVAVAGVARPRAVRGGRPRPRTEGMWELTRPAAVRIACGAALRAPTTAPPRIAEHSLERHLAS